jgi:hypothetical protein
MVVYMRYYTADRRANSPLPLRRRNCILESLNKGAEDSDTVFEVGLSCLVLVASVVTLEGAAGDVWLSSVEVEIGFDGMLRVRSV